MKYVPSTIENAPEVDALMKGYGYNSVKEESESTSVSVNSYSSSQNSYSIPDFC